MKNHKKKLHKMAEIKAFGNFNASPPGKKEQLDDQAHSVPTKGLLRAARVQPHNQDQQCVRSVYGLSITRVSFGGKAA